MSIFEKFKKKKMPSRQELEASQREFKRIWEANIDEIWGIKDRNSFVIAMNGWICRKCNYGESIALLSPQERIFYVVQGLEAEVNNGGFSQFFFNSSGDFANELVDSFIAIGAEKTANICKKAMDSFGCAIPVNKNDRESFLDYTINDEINRILEECDNEFYRYSDNLEELNYEFIMKHKSCFN